MDELRSSLSPSWDRYGPGRGRCGLVIDADRTLAAEDSGRLVGGVFGLNEEIRQIFETLGYVSGAFERVAGTWGRIPCGAYLGAAEAASRKVHVRDAWVDILMAARDRRPVVVVSAGIPHVWRRALDHCGFQDIPVVGGCHPRVDNFLVFPRTKATLVDLLRGAGWRVLAAGDSPIDLPMLQRADIPLFVPDAKGSPALRSLLGSVPAVRHLLVDERRFDQLATMTPCQVVEMLAD
ncbi:MAG: HAD family hydrolase [Thermoplasmata archaeon]